MKSNLKQLPRDELERRLKRCRKCYWWVEDKGFCRFNWLIQNNGWSYRRMCGYDPNMLDRFTKKA